MRIFPLLVVMGLLVGCSDDTSSKDAAVPDASVHDNDAGGGDKGTVVDLPAGDAAQPVACTNPSDPCPGSLSCLCCGSIGPAPICLCSKACSATDDCKGTDLPECNKAPGADAGICTPTGYNCCWLCQ